jgi:hypothetical protein
MRYFCTYFDHNYLPRVLALYHSLVKHSSAFHLFALCMDEDAYGSFERLQLPQTTAFRLGQLECANEELLRAKQGRSKVEYYYTCGPAFLLYLLDCHSQIDLITYLDADLFFFSDPKPLFDDLESFSVGIVEHRFPKRQAKLKRFGIYNVGWVSFRRDEHGLECLRWWVASCIEWCYDRVEENRYADQKYLNQFPLRFKSVRVLRHPGANLAPWNVANHRITEHHDRVWVDDQALIFFHFQGFRVITSWLFDTNLGGYQASPSPIVKRKVFGPYISEMRRLSSQAGPVRSLRNSSRNSSRGYGIFVRSLRTGVQLSFGILRRAYIVAFSKSAP